MWQSLNRRWPRDSDRPLEQNVLPDRIDAVFRSRERPADARQLTGGK
ncbi:hypothetical protein HALLA_08525 [Halostagnicola larsenii XH-48]|uniref:Uncharacterized protein n=1 Tax=Halostagnicola larsenii XH-48 TaxID=797299 RepID=W0JUW1_9EURY|nr:hypothetical protein HALLA_08525 [Halostagnicola larsenii XH-48]